MLNITAAEFKAKCLKIMDDVAVSREEVIITKRGKAIAKVTPLESPSTSPFGYLKGTLTAQGNIIHSCTSDLWEANQ